MSWMDAQDREKITLAQALAEAIQAHKDAELLAIENAKLCTTLAAALLQLDKVREVFARWAVSEISDGTFTRLLSEVLSKKPHHENCDVNDPIIKTKPCNCRGRLS